MFRWASRITLEVVSVRVERLNDISEADSIAEGIETGGVKWKDYLGGSTQSAATSCASLWDSINGLDAWSANPGVWVGEFRQVEAAQ
jgi:hypothetical protein